jgi:hypothetical protein
MIHRSEKGNQMRRQVRAALGPVLAIGLTLGASAAPTAARTTGRESIKGTIVATGAGATRTVVSSAIFATGAFTGAGRDVEVASRPGDPQNVSRDDLAFPRATIHIVNTSQPPMGSMNPQTCAGTVRIKQVTKVWGGTASFRHASGTFAGTLRGWGVAPRKPDGTCEQQAELLLEVDVISMRGTLSF